MVTPNIVAATTGRRPPRSSTTFGARTIPARAWAAFDRAVLVSRFSPAMSSTGWNMAMSDPPTNGRVWPLAWVLTITLGTPKGKARIAEVPMTVPAEPPRPKTPSTFPASCRSRTTRATTSADQDTASPRSIPPGKVQGPSSMIVSEVKDRIRSRKRASCPSLKIP